MIVIDDNINDKCQIDDGKRWQSIRTLDVGIRTPNEPNDPYCGHLKITWWASMMTWHWRALMTRLKSLMTKVVDIYDMACLMTILCLWEFGFCEHWLMFEDITFEAMYVTYECWKKPILKLLDPWWSCVLQEAFDVAKANGPKISPIFLLNGYF